MLYIFRSIFCDFGTDFPVVDTNGEQVLSVMVSAVSREEKAIVTCLDERRHGFEDGDFVTFHEVGSGLYFYLPLLSYFTNSTLSTG